MNGRLFVLIRGKKNKGFTLIEATIAMVILAIAAAGILLPFANAASVQAEGSTQTIAATLASEMMERILATSYADVIATYGSFEEADGALLDAAWQVHAGSIYTGFSRSATCQSATVGSINLIAATVTVSYKGREVTRLTTLIGDHE